MGGAKNASAGIALEVQANIEVTRAGTVEWNMPASTASAVSVTVFREKDAVDFPA